MDRWARWGMAALVLFTVSAIVAGWRYFPGFSGDHAWYLQVALRVSQGEVLYRDVAWAYGPLPAQALAAFFRSISSIVTGPRFSPTIAFEISTALPSRVF